MNASLTGFGWYFEHNGQTNGPYLTLAACEAVMDEIEQREQLLAEQRRKALEDAGRQLERQGAK